MTNTQNPKHNSSQEIGKQHIKQDIFYFIHMNCGYELQ